MCESVNYYRKQIYGKLNLHSTGFGYNKKRLNYHETVWNRFRVLTKIIKFLIETHSKIYNLNRNLLFSSGKGNFLGRGVVRVGRLTWFL